MKFIKHIMIRVTLTLSILFGAWAVLFYYIIVDEVTDETDDVLEDYSAMIIQNFLAGEPMPINDNGSNNTYYLRAIPADSISILKFNEGFSNEEIYIKYKKETEPARVLRQIFRDIDNNAYEVTVITPTIDGHDLINAIWKSLIFLFLLMLIILLVINAFAIKSGLRPLHKFLHWVNNSNIESCELPEKQNTEIKEIKELITAVELFAQRGRRAFEEQKEFIGNASHELQTPIAICQNRLELLRESELNQQQMKDISESLKILARLSKLNKSLLMLSKIENGGFNVEEVCVNNIVIGNIEILEEVNVHRNIVLTFTELSQCVVMANKELVSILVSNLIRNSYSHNCNGGKINIEISSDFISISNSGTEKPLDSTKIFNRFYQGSTKSGTYGLGLAIVKSICKLYHFNLEYNYIDNMHRFLVKFN